MFKPILAAAALALTTTAIVAPAPATAYPADSWSQGLGHGWNRAAYRDRRYHRPSRGYRRCYDKGNGGLAIGGVAGALAGHAIAGNGDKTLGTILGAGAGALTGRAIDKSDGRPCR